MRPTPSAGEPFEVDHALPDSDAFSEQIRHASSLKYIPGLDGLRAIAILGVMFFHFVSFYQAQLSAAGPLWAAIANLCKTGWMGVDLFFALSGYLVTRVIASAKHIDAGFYRRYIARRARRLLPAYLSCVVLVTILLLVANPSSKVLHNSYLLWTFTPDFQTLLGSDRMALGDQYVSLVHFWTLALEWQFYLLFPIVVVLCRSITRAAVALIAIAIACRTVLHVIGASDNGIYSFLFCRIDSLAFGCLFAVNPGYRLIPYRRPLLLLSLMALAVVIYCIDVDPIAFKLIDWLQIIGYSVIGAAFAVVVWFVATSPRHSVTLKWLEHPLLSALGRSSYSLYIWHLIFYPSIVLFVNAHIADGRLAAIAAFGIGMASAAILGALSFRWIEWSMIAKRRPT
ncbi:acyltransferase [Paraburkholderia tropica]|uniref:acyltransferase family protein n=2 Tax=Paraburkholderia tropica TaxID=92647 RepID=UPI0016140624|nr:acyltransferase [Paraburkholderia tropica]MBB2981900.1 peptidoglycan/LPS O-acetylase OafA/YrhL [Paraburkholderia tropica]